jgi:hypothetical protein
MAVAVITAGSMFSCALRSEAQPAAGHPLTSQRDIRQTEKNSSSAYRRIKLLKQSTDKFTVNAMRTSRRSRIRKAPLLMVALWSAFGNALAAQEMPPSAQPEGSRNLATGVADPSETQPPKDSQGQTPPLAAPTIPTYSFPSADQRFKHYLTRSFGPRAFLRPALQGALDQRRNEPEAGRLRLCEALCLVVCSKRHLRNYALWPERSFPRRSEIPQM